MALKRLSQPTDGTIPIVALLYGDEQLLGSQDNVGIYDGQQKSPRHQSGTVSITSHRLFYIDGPHPRSQSFAIDLACVSRTDFYAGLFTSSPKITMYLSADSIPAEATQSQAADNSSNTLSGSWECQVCAYRNPPGLSPAAARICGLCGVPRDAMSSDEQPTLQNTTSHLSSSLPSPSGFANASRSVSSTPGQPAPSGNDPIPCPACTFLNHPSLRTCEICEADLPRVALSSSSTSRRGMKSAPVSRPHSPGADDDPANMLIKISFRKGGDKPTYALLKRSLKTKAWESTRANTADGGDAGENRGVGISAILRTVENSAQGRQSNMQDALQDLEALMIKAKDMVHLAAELNEKLTAAASSASSSSLFITASSSPSNQNDASTSSTSTTDWGSNTTTLASPPPSEPEEATFIRSSLTQLGLHMDNAPVTLDMIKDERKWHEELARELARVLQGSSSWAATTSSSSSKGGPTTQVGGLMKDRGIIALDEVWGGWNRARGVALIPPSTFLQTLPLLPTHTSPPIQTRTFPSGLKVLHTPPYHPSAFSARLSGFLVMNGPKTTLEVALEMEGEKVGVEMCREMVEASEREGDVCRDDVGEAGVGVGVGGVGVGAGGGVDVRWWPNLFVGYVWDGQVDV